MPHANPGSGYAIGAPTITGGITYVTTDQGHVVAITDTPLRRPAGYQCTNEFINPSLGPLWNVICIALGYQLVATPKVIADVTLPDGSDAAGLRNEPAITRGKLHVATSGGHAKRFCGPPHYLIGNDPWDHAEAVRLHAGVKLGP